jgi:hypothetical protein
VNFPQLVQFSAHPRPLSALFLSDSLARIPIADLKEIRRLSRLLPLIQQVPQPELEGREGARLARPSCGAIQKHKQEDEFAFLDTEVHFATKDRLRRRLQVLALARSTLTTGGHTRGFHGSLWRS